MKCLCAGVVLLVLESIPGATHAETTAATKAAMERKSTVTLEGASFTGVLLDNVANKARQGSGFNPLCSLRYPLKNLYRDDAVGLNFEHVFNGMAADRDASMFTPRKDPCVLRAESKNRVSIEWPAKDSSWGLDCEMHCSLADADAIDLAFAVTPTADRFGLGYIALMWASYMNRARDRRIYFLGKNGDKEGWTTFGDDLPTSFETGTVSAVGVDNLPYQEGAQTLNLIEQPSKHFLYPFFYGLLDGDHDLSTTEDTLAYIVMFDQRETIRFALWNFITDSSGKPDTHSPAWDWQFVIRTPRIGETYRYRARILVKPFEGPDAVYDEYQRWSRQINKQK